MQVDQQNQDNSYQPEEHYERVPEQQNQMSQEEYMAAMQAQQDENEYQENEDED